MDYLNKLISIHDNLKFTNKEALLNELPEQLMILKHLKPNDKVLELGGSIGRSSCIISSILSNKNNHVVIEPNNQEAELLKINRDLNQFSFHIENSAISNVKLYSRGWYTYKYKIEDSMEVNTITLQQLNEKYNIDFNVLIIDNEGNFVDNLKEFSDILNNIRLLQIEHDFNTNEDLEFFKKNMNDKGFRITDIYLKTDKFGPGMNWWDGLITDPIFVSVWEK